jgi:hypothetical protein
MRMMTEHQQGQQQQMQQMLMHLIPEQQQGQQQQTAAGSQELGDNSVPNTYPTAVAARCTCIPVACCINSSACCCRACRVCCACCASPWHDFGSDEQQQSTGPLVREVSCSVIKSIVETRWWSLHTHIASFCANKDTLIFQRDAPRNPIVPSDVYNLGNNDWMDMGLIQEILCAIQIVQVELEGEKYITGSLVIQLLEGERARLESTRMHFVESEAPTGDCFIHPAHACCFVLFCHDFCFMLPRSTTTP